MDDLQKLIGLAILRKKVLSELDLEDIGGALKQGAKNFGQYWGSEGPGGKKIGSIAKTTRDYWGRDIKSDAPGAKMLRGAAKNVKEFYGERGTGGKRLRAAGRALAGKERESKLSMREHLKKGAAMLTQRAKAAAEAGKAGAIKHAGKIGAGATAAGLGAAALAARKKKM